MNPRRPKMTWQQPGSVKLWEIVMGRQHICQRFLLKFSVDILRGCWL